MKMYSPLPIIQKQSASDTNAIKSLKEKIIEIKSAQTAATKNKSNLTGQVSDTRQDYWSNIIDKEYGIIKEDINIKAEIANKELMRPKK